MIAEIAEAGWGIWALMIFVFVVGPAMRWGWRGGRHGWDPGGDWRGGHRHRRLDRDDEALRAALEERDETVDLLETRVAELENRLDFAERLLAEGRRSELDHPVRTDAP